MTFFWDLVLALLIGLLLTGIYAIGFRKAGQWASLIAFFAIVFLTAWSGGVWLLPRGPAVMGVRLLAFTLVGVIVALIIAALAPPAYPRSPQAAQRHAAQEKFVARALNVYFWLLLGILIGSIAIGYTRP